MINEKASLVQIPSGYKGGTLYSVVPNTSAGDFTVTGDPEGEATRVNKDGLIESVAANVPRLNYNFIDGVVQPDPHLLLEPQRINRVFPNNSLTGYSTIGVSTTNNSATSPNGANEGAKVQATTSGTAVVFKGFTGTSGVTHNISAFVKAGTHNQVRLQEGFSSSYIDVNLTNGTEVSSQNATNKKIEEYPNGWYRVSFNFTTSGTNLQFAVYFNGTYLSGENIYLYGGQIEEGSYATSLIPTTGSAVTRTADNAQIASGAEDIIGSQNEGTLFIDLEIPYDTTSSDYFQFCISDGATTNDRVLINFRSQKADFQVFSGGSGVGFCDTPVTKNTRLKIAGSYETDNFVLFKDGLLADTIDTLGVVDFTTQMETIRYADFGNGLKFQAKVYQTMFFKEVLTQDELETLTSYRSFNEMATQQLYIIE